MKHAKKAIRDLLIGSPLLIGLLLIEHGTDWNRAETFSAGACLALLVSLLTYWAHERDRE